MKTIVDAAAGQVSTVFDGVRTVVKPQAAVAVATTFGFPLVLTLAVLLFLIVQSRLDRRDPKLATGADEAEQTPLAFEEEDVL